MRILCLLSVVVLAGCVTTQTPVQIESPIAPPNLTPGFVGPVQRSVVKIVSRAEPEVVIAPPPADIFIPITITKPVYDCVSATTNLSCGDFVTPSKTYHFDWAVWNNVPFTITTNYLTNGTAITTNTTWNVPRTPGAQAEYFMLYPVD